MTLDNSLERFAWPVTCAALALWALLATAQVINYRLRIVNIGSAAEWATAAVTFLGLCAAIWAGSAAYGQLTLMRGGAAGRAVDTLERQARQVFALHFRDSQPGGTVTHRVVIDNRSDEPIVDAVLLILARTSRGSFRCGVIPPRTSFDVPAAGQQVNDEIKMIIGGNEVLREVASIMEFEFPVVFTDARNVRWLRHADYTLSQVPLDYSFGDPEVYEAAAARSRFKITEDTEGGSA